MSRPCTLGVGCAEAGTCYASAHGQPERCDAKPDEPQGEASVWYRGWEVGFDQMAHDYTGRGWRAYRGGVDLDARTADGATYEDCLDDVDAEEDDA